MTGELPDHVRRNRDDWDRHAPDWVAAGRFLWNAEEPVWGVWRVPEAQVGMLAGELDGLDAIELGCGTGYVSAWLARRGARPVGIDISQAQLATARQLQQEFGLDFPLLHGNAEAVPLPDASFDLAISDTARASGVTRTRGSPRWHGCCAPAAGSCSSSTRRWRCSARPMWPMSRDRLLRPYFGLHRMEWPDDGSVEFTLPHGERIALLHRSGFEIDELVEIRPPDGSTNTYHPNDSLEWAQRWPCEEVWKVRRRA